MQATSPCACCVLRPRSGSEHDGEDPVRVSGWTQVGKLSLDDGIGRM